MAHGPNLSASCFCNVYELRMLAKNFINGRKKSKEEYLLTWKLYETEILVSINKILLARYVHSVKYMSTFALQVAEFIVSRDGNGLQILKYFTIRSCIEEVYQPLT